ncbi:hypothetical protein QAD02_003614 [Eretmocerus hayati]|uniref:Uncharacterized protein n=2 Tax=Eretmocerus hayati TaxID=131215 RepID=A0ACC2NM79_9HYME|nr:hypothetical protein QAD02_003246 [Eretmocerus hayati]KAJ8672355.1 hypothetical protein QAD02_003614 [Eretmocerus hayati]
MRPELQARLGDSPRQRSRAQKEKRRERERARRAAKRVAKEALQGDLEINVTPNPDPRLRSIIVRPEGYLPVPHPPKRTIIVVGRPRRRATLSDSATRVSGFQPRAEDRHLVDECYWSGSETSSCDCSDFEGPSPSPVTIPERNKSRLQSDVPATCVPLRIPTNPVPPESQIPAPRPPARETPPERSRAPRSGLAALRDPRRFGKARRRLALEQPSRSIHFEAHQLPRNRSESRRRSLKRLHQRPNEKVLVRRRRPRQD